MSDPRCRRRLGYTLAVGFPCLAGALVASFKWLEEYGFIAFAPILDFVGLVNAALAFGGPAYCSLLADPLSRPMWERVWDAVTFGFGGLMVACVVAAGGCLLLFSL